MSEYCKNCKKMADQLSVLREGLEAIKENANCHRDFSDEVIRRLPDTTYFIVMEARRQSDIAAETLKKAGDLV